MNVAPDVAPEGRCAQNVPSPLWGSREPDRNEVPELHKDSWAARVSNPARRIKRPVHPVLARVAWC
jgi:hypothetical protein